MHDELIEALRLCAKYGKADDALENAKQAADAIEELQKAVLRLEEASGILDELPMYQQPVGWIPVTERLPEHGWYLAYGPTIKMEVLHFHSVEEVWSSERYYNIEVTHWMPLPEPPEEEST